MEKVVVGSYWFQKLEIFFRMQVAMPKETNMFLTLNETSCRRNVTRVRSSSIPFKCVLGYYTYTYSNIERIFEISQHSEF